MSAPESNSGHLVRIFPPGPKARAANDSGLGTGGGNTLPPDGSGPYDSDMEPRIVKLETKMDAVLDTLQEIRTDMREFRVETRDLRKEMASEFKAVRHEGVKVALWLLSAGVAAFAILAGIVAKGFHWF